jgi:ABC-2 type transport system ATP-binding protein
LLSTHNLAEVEASCARAIIISNGRIVADGPLDEIRAKSGRVRYVVSIQESAEAGKYRGRGPLPKKGDVEDALGKVDGVKKLGELPTDSARPTGSSARARRRLRPNPQLIVDRVLLELRRDAQTLEDVFRNLTIGDERRNRSLSPVPEDADGEDTEDEDEDDEADDEGQRAAGRGDGDEKAAKADRS